MKATSPSTKTLPLFERLRRALGQFSVAGFKREFHSPSVRFDPEQLRTMFVRLVLLRVSVLSLLLGSVTWEAFRTDGRPQPGSLIFWAIALTYAVSLVNVWIVRRTANPRIAGCCQLAIDVVLATLAIYATNSAVSIFLYLLIIVAAAVTFSMHGAVSIAACCGVSYALLSAGVFPVIGGRGQGVVTSASEIFTVYMALVLIALVSGYLSRQMEVMGVIADLNARSLNDLSEQQKQLLDDISEGVITVDLESTITGINQAARAILGLSQVTAAQFVGMPLPEVLRDQGFGDADRLLTNPSASRQTVEIALKHPRRDAELRLNYSLRPLLDRDGREIGRIVLFNDVSHVRSIEERLNLHEEMTKLLAHGADDEGGITASLHESEMIGQSPIMQRVYQLVERVALSDASVLINGESGTGKELIAKAVHAHSSRRSNPFVAINCGAIPENLIESELFGHKKGAYTGAISDSIGLFRQAHGGTIFLDEIGELPIHMQTKLLRVLQEKSIRAVGDTKDVSVDVRILAATNRDLKREIKAGTFREDLYYRLNVVNIVVPPLRDRKEDVPLLVRHFVGRLCPPEKILPQISPEAIQQLMNYPFPGNIRELENVIERALVLGGQAILPEHLPDEVTSFRSRDGRSEVVNQTSSEQTKVTILPVDLEKELERLERLYLSQALEQSRGIKKHAAELLGLNFRSFRYRLKKYGMAEGAGGEDEA